MGDWGINAAEDFALREAAKKAGVNYDGRTFSRRAGENPQVNQLMNSIQNQAGTVIDQGQTADGINPSQQNFVPWNFSVDADGSGVQGSYQPNKNVKIDFNYDTRQGPGIYGGGNFTF